jgi:hypothetical protein
VTHFAASSEGLANSLSRFCTLNVQNRYVLHDRRKMYVRGARCEEGAKGGEESKRKKQ